MWTPTSGDFRVSWRQVMLSLPGLLDVVQPSPECSRRRTLSGWHGSGQKILLALRKCDKITDCWSWHWDKMLLGWLKSAVLQLWKYSRFLKMCYWSSVLLIQPHEVIWSEKHLNPESWILLHRLNLIFLSVFWFLPFSLGSSSSSRFLWGPDNCFTFSTLPLSKAN